MIKKVFKGFAPLSYKIAIFYIKMRSCLRFPGPKTINFNPDHTFHLKEAPASHGTWLDIE
jgi:hypothetical protein